MSELNNINSDKAMQVFRKTAESLVAEKEILRYLRGNPLPMEKNISARLFNALLKEIKSEDKTTYVENGIPYNYNTGGGIVEYILRSK
jgi:hypothetical protein